MGSLVLLDPSYPTSFLIITNVSLIGLSLLRFLYISEITHYFFKVFCEIRAPQECKGDRDRFLWKECYFQGNLVKLYILGIFQVLAFSAETAR